jgi:predicted DCC family thiol-disulfide oxidoreductase YuxK
MPEDTGTTIIYDGDCPFCSAFVRMARLRAAAGPVRLVSARSTDKADAVVLARVAAAGLDLDRGMVVDRGGALYHGDAAMTLLALMTTPSGRFNRLVRLAFANRRVARIAYPPLVAGRNLTLRLLGRKSLAQAPYRTPVGGSGPG